MERRKAEYRKGFGGTNDEEMEDEEEGEQTDSRSHHNLYVPPHKRGGSLKSPRASSSKSNGYLSRQEEQKVREKVR